MYYFRSNLNNVDIIEKNFICLCGSYYYIKEIFELIMILIFSYICLVDNILCVWGGGGVKKRFRFCVIFFIEG